MNQDLLVSTGNLDAYIQAVNSIPVLSAEEERELAVNLQQKQDLNAARKLVLPHLRFVVHIARGYSGYGLPLADLSQEGNEVRFAAKSDDAWAMAGTTRALVGNMVEGVSQGFEKKLVLKRSDGTSLYTTRDLAYHKWKAERSDRMIDVLGADHKLISGQLKAALRLMGVREPEIVIFEFVSLPTGSMSTRKGKFISTDELLDEVEAQAYKEVTARRPEEAEEFRRAVAKDVALGAVRYDVVKVSPDKATVFDWKAALDFEKLSAPFIQYSHARACSILDKAGDFGEFDPGLLAGPEEVDLIKKISQFDLAVELAGRELKPHLLATYARELAETFNQFYRSSPVLEAEPGVREARLALVKAARNCLRATLETLGIPALESM